MARYREFKKIDHNKVRNLCIRDEYYTMGDNDAYEHLLYELCNEEKEITMDELEEITADIMKHSDVEWLRYKYYFSEEELFAGILWKLINECCTIFLEKTGNETA